MKSRFRMLLVLSLVLLTTASSAAEGRYVIATIANLREQPTTDAKIVAKLPISTQVKVEREGDKWSQVVVQGGNDKDARGWLLNELLVSERPVLEGLLKAYDVAQKTPDNYQERQKWAERIVALDRVNSEELRRTTLGKGREGDLYPFADMNSIKVNGIYKAQTGIVFQTFDGITNYEPLTKKWTYAIFANKGVRADVLKGSLWAAVGVSGVEFPSWYKQSSYSGIVAAASKADASWLLTSNGNEGAVCDGQDIIDVKRKSVFRLPCEGFHSLWVDNGVAWLGSAHGATAVNLTTRERVDYLTLPETNGIVDAFEIDQFVYYGTSYAGAYVVDRRDGSVRAIDSINKELLKARRLEDMVFYNGKIIFLMTAVDKTGWYRRQSTLLGIYDISSSETSIIDTGVDIATRLIVHRNSVFGYGNKEEWIEGGQRVGFYGGAFEYNFHTRKVKRLQNHPLSYFSPKDGIGISVDRGLGAGSSISIAHHGKYVTYTQLAIVLYKTVPNSDELEEVKYEEPIYETDGRLMRAVPSGFTHGPFPSQTNELLDLEATDPRMEAVKLIVEMRDFEKRKMQDRESRVGKVTSSLRVRPRTISISRDKVKIVE